MNENTSKVYVLMDDQSRIVRCEGGYTTGNITDPENWVQIDEGTGDRYNLCQSHYFEGGLYTDDGIPRYKLVDGQAVERSEEELETERLGPIRNARIAQSKTDLAAYLASHPLQWTDGEYYSITAEKQQQLTSKLMAATMAQTLSTEYTLTWNSAGEVCKAWTLQDLSALAFAIDARVTALVTYQQTKEVAMRDAETLEELEAIVVDYDSVGATV